VPKSLQGRQAAPYRGKKGKRGKTQEVVRRFQGPTAQMLAEPDTVEEWDDEELERGRRRSADGTFKGFSPSVVSIEVHRERMRRTLVNANNLFRESAERAVEVLREIMDSPFSEDRDKIAAAKIVIERTMGKTPDRVEVSLATPKWMEALKGGIVMIDSDEDDDDIIIDDDVIDVEWEDAG
jgi:hypothetical protein